MSAGVCRRCRRAIVFGWTVDNDTRVRTGKRMPLDDARLERDDERANVAAYRDGSGALVVRVLKKGEEPDRHEWRMMPHFATCQPVNVAARKITRARRSLQFDEGAGTLDLAGVDADVIPFRPRPRA